MWQYSYSDELKHYGVIGMKWGVRRDKAKALTKATKKLKKLEDKAIKAKVKEEKTKARLSVKAASASTNLSNAQARYNQKLLVDSQPIVE